MKLPAHWTETETRSNRPGTWRYQVRSPARFRKGTLRTVPLTGVRGVKIIAGKLESGDPEILRHEKGAMVPQAVIFSKAEWPTFRDALGWQESHFTSLENPARMNQPGGTFQPGDRVALHPGLNEWMQGDRYGEVVKVQKHTGYVEVILDSGRRRRYHPERLTLVRHRENPRRSRRPSILTVPEQHQLRIAKDTLRMSDAVARIMGGMTKDEARALIRRLLGEVAVEWYDAPLDNPAPPQIKWHEAPRGLTELARNRVHYEGGRFLVPDILSMTQEERRRILDYLVRIKWPPTFEAGTEVNLIAEAARELAASPGGDIGRGSGTYWSKVKEQMERRRPNPRHTGAGRVAFSKREIEDFRSQWPVSGIPAKAITFQFDPSGDLVGTRPGNALDNADAGAVSALISDARELLSRREGRGDFPITLIGDPGHAEAQRKAVERITRRRGRRRPNPAGHWYDTTEVDTWFERDRAHVELRWKDTGETIVEWWDDEVEQAIEDGFLDPSDYHTTALEYAEHLGALQDAARRRRTTRGLERSRARKPNPSRGRKGKASTAAVRMFRHIHGGKHPTGFRVRQIPDLDELVMLGNARAIDYQLEPHVARGARNTPYRHAFGRGSMLLTDPTGRALVIVGNLKVSRGAGGGRYGYIREASGG